MPELLTPLRKHTPESWMILYIERWLEAPVSTSEGEILVRTQGVPQGGVISPLLMNLFLHYAFDNWMQSTQARNPFARYADDAVIHCRSRNQARWMLGALARRLEDCKLTMHPTKSKVVYCKVSRRRGDYESVQFTFLGFTFRPRCAKGMMGISKRGDRTLRKMLIHGARTVLNWCGPKTDKLSLWLKALSSRAHRCKVIVALANKLARIAWAVLASGKPYQAQAV